ncbi:MAG: cell division protein FtsQ/DivIB [Pseudomonadota bacterium]|nr:cell division protein FtsQ/DivIB [Pseudomonadota bacterium]
MSARVRRGGGAPKRKAAQRVQVPRKLARKLPVSHARANRWAAAAFGLFLALIAAVVLVALDVPAKAMNAAGEAVGDAGFRVSRVDVTGIRNMDSAPVYQIALDQKTMAMPLVDVHGIRQQLLRYGWVKDARVSRRLPDTLVVDIVERQPTALWQDRSRLALIDSEGVVLDRVQVGQMPDLPLLIGAGANHREQELNRLLGAVPTLKPQLVSANWVGNRRWDLKFQSGETVALPEGEQPARAALAKFAELDKTTGLLGRGLVRFDLRFPDKMIVRLPRGVQASGAPAPSAG